MKELNRIGLGRTVFRLTFGDECFVRADGDGRTVPFDVRCQHIVGDQPLRKPITNAERKRGKIAFDRQQQPSLTVGVLNRDEHHSCGRNECQRSGYRINGLLERQL